MVKSKASWCSLRRTHTYQRKPSQTHTQTHTHTHTVRHDVIYQSVPLTHTVCPDIHTHTHTHTCVHTHIPVYIHPCLITTETQLHAQTVSSTQQQDAHATLHPQI